MLQTIFSQDFTKNNLINFHRIDKKINNKKLIGDINLEARLSIENFNKNTYVGRNLQINELRHFAKLN